MNNRNLANRLLAMAAAGLLTANCAAVMPAAAESAEDGTPELVLEAADLDGAEALYVEQTSYSDYYDLYGGQTRPETPIVIEAASFSDATGEIATGSYGTDGDMRDNVLLWNDTAGSVTYTVDVPETGIYCMEFSYFPMENSFTSVELSLLINGELPYDTAERLTLTKAYVNEKDIYYDERGNQIRPSQVQKGMWMESFAKDVDGLFNDPLIVYLEQGTNEITLEGVKAQLALETITFRQPDALSSYAELKPAQSEIDATPSVVYRIEGESAALKSDATLYPTYDNSSYLASPSNPTKQVYNTIGNANWKKALQTITWEFNVDADGWYKIGIKARQQDMRGFSSNRRIYVDGEVLYEELDDVTFPYSASDWVVVSPTDENGDAIYVYLTGGQQHTIAMEVIPGEIGDVMRRLDDIIKRLNTCYRQIIMITGPDPDLYNDANSYVHESVPTLIPEFEALSAELNDIYDRLAEISTTEGFEAVQISQMVMVLDKCIEKPKKIARYLSQIKDNVSSLSSWMCDYRDQPLEIDYIEIASADQAFSSTDESFFQQFSFGFQSFIGSFTEDYTQLTDVEGEDTIEVWVSLGRDQAQVVKELVESDFAPNHPDVNIAVNLVVGGVVEATLADAGPDVALFLGGEFPVNLAARGLLVDLSAYSDYEEIAGRFQENADVQYTYDGDVYGIPLTQTWTMMFYRTDILTELGFTAPPETWDDLIDMLPALQRSYMNVGLILPAANVSAATEAGHTFATLLLQRGSNYFNEGQTATTFDSIDAVQAFEDWTDLYTEYRFQQSYDPYSRFRTGEYPIVISNYSFFNQLEAAAPEIKGLWSFTSIPGTLQEDGSVSHATNSSGSCGVIFNQVSDADAAWEFLKWFSSTETQVSYGTNIEGLLGQLGRYETANIDALQQLSWSAEEMDKLMAQWEELEEIPVIPASYAVTRNIMNAFRETVNNNENPRDTLMWYNRDINEEITRKRENLGLDD